MSTNTRKYSHKTKKCYIEVDEQLAPFVQYILDNYSYEIIPIASCQGNKNKPAYILLFVRKLEAINSLIFELQLRDYMIIEYFDTNIFRFEWESKNTKEAFRMIHHKKDK
ncbi:MAG: hypothetical protein ACOC2W_04830 [bacterium]